MVTHLCDRCGKTFNKKSNYDQHLRKVKQCIKKINFNSQTNIEDTEINKKEQQPKIFECDKCGHCFTRYDNLLRHTKKNCGSTGSIMKEIRELKSIIKDMAQRPTAPQQPSQIINQSVNNINQLQVVCVGNKDNYLDMLTEKWGDFDRALDYIRDCALSSLTGDCKLLGKIYFDPNQQIEHYPIKFCDKNRYKLSFINEKQEKIVDPKGILLGKRLANNLQNTYLKGVNYVIKKNSPTVMLEEYDLQLWNRHILELSDEQYQRKIINHLDVSK